MAALDALNTAAWSPIAGRSARDINFENSVHERNRRVNASLENPALAPGDGQWDAFWGGVDRTRDAAADEGKGFGINFAGFGRPSTGVSAMPSASSALMARAGVDDPWEGAGSQQGYQSRRLGFNRDVNNYRDELVHQLEAGDPNVMAQKAREQADVQNAGLDRLQQGTDQRAIDTFGRTESLRMNQGRERVRDAAELLPFTPAYAAALAREQGVYDTNDTKEHVAQIAGNARTGAAATSAFGRVAAAPTFTPTDTARVGSASSALAERAGLPYEPPADPSAPPPDPSRTFPADRLAAFAQQHGLDEASARAFIAERGYTIR